jgi:hypothetical protein
MILYDLADCACQYYGFNKMLTFVNCMMRMPRLGEVPAKAGLLIALLVLGVDWQSGAGAYKQKG